MLGILNKFFDSSEKQIKKLDPIVTEINELEKKIAKLTDAKLKDKTKEFKKRLEKGVSLDDILPEAYAVAREAGKRTLGQRHYDVQLLAGIVLHQGKIAEQRTGEGKTLTASLALYLNSLTEKGVHLATVNDYLAKRDAVWMAQIYDYLGISVGIVQNQRVSFIYDAKTLKYIKSIEVGKMPHAIRVAPDGKYAFTSNRQEGSISIIDMTSSKEISKVKVGRRPAGFDVTPDSKNLYVANELDGSVSINEVSDSIMKELD